MLTAERGAGTRIVAVDPASPLGRAGCVANDVITAIDRIRTPAPRDVRRILAEAPEGSFVVATVRRDDRQRVIAIEIPSADAPVR
jgi:S1-C subfamily serine protease